jgi:hypothetical protein
MAEPAKVRLIVNPEGLDLFGRALQNPVAKPDGSSSSERSMELPEQCFKDARTDGTNSKKNLLVPTEGLEINVADQSLLVSSQLPIAVCSCENFNISDGEADEY